MTMENYSILNSLKTTGKNTGLIFDDRMMAHYSPWDPDFIENPKRYSASLQRCKDYDLLKRCSLLTPRLATEDEIMTVHDKKYIKDIKITKSLESDIELEQQASRYDSVYFNNSTYDCSLLSTGCTLELVSKVLSGEVKNGLAIVRPPGHHAMEKEACGFCYFNNVAIAAKHALEKFNVKKILIVDWDVHHGQATQRTFYDDPRVLYFSIHRYEHGKFWPHLEESNFSFAGNANGTGFNVNVPLNSITQGNSEYLAIFNNVLLPIAYEFAPELVLISAGFDAALGCPEGQMEVYPHAYPHFLNALAPLAGGRICVILEGGYCIPSLAESVALCLKGLLGDPCPPMPQCLDINQSTVETVLNVLSVQNTYWDSLKLQNTYDLHDSQDMFQETSDHDDTKHVVEIKYTGNPLKDVTVFETRAYYPFQQPHIKAAYAVKINDLIGKTDLTMPDPLTAFACSNSDVFNSNIFKNLMQSKLLQRCVALKSDEHMTDLKLSDEINLESTLTGEFLNNLKNDSNFIGEVKDASKILADSLLLVAESVVKKLYRNGLALLSSKSQTYNSVCILLKYLLDCHKMQRILVVDWSDDEQVQKKFSQDHRVLYVSLQGNSKEDDVGSGYGTGYSINIPLSGMSDGDYVASFFHLLLPIAYEYSPEIVIVSAVPQLQHFFHLNCNLPSTTCIFLGIKLLNSLCNGKLVVACDSSYPEGLNDIATSITAALLNEDVCNLPSFQPSPGGISALKKVRGIQKKYWKCLKFDKALPSSSIELSPMSKKYFNKRRQSNPVSIPNRDRPGCSKSLDCNVDIGDAFGSAQYFCVTPLEYCPHLDLLQPLPKEGLDPKAPCSICKDPSENWVCLHCYQVYCGRFINQHMLQHGTDMGHYLTLSYSDLSAWCYACDAYIHNPALSGIKEHACQRKFS